MNGNNHVNVSAFLFAAGNRVGGAHYSLFETKGINGNSMTDYNCLSRNNVCIEHSSGAS